MTGGRRSAGILLHPTSLPGPGPIGTLGPDAFRFVDLLERAGATRWQILPLTPVGDGGSPYHSVSSFAGNELLISAAALQQDGLLPEGYEVAPFHDPSAADFGLARTESQRALREAFLRLSPAQWDEIAAYRREQRAWLEDYALCRALRQREHGLPWTDWPESLRRRAPSALEGARRELDREIAFECFVQWCFDRQWLRLREYAHARGVQVIGDIPIFPALDSADVWAAQHLFKLDDAGHPTVVTGVPPDYFSATGQLWGNPHYAWERHAEDGFAWWRERFAQAFRRVDIVRIDHFRAFAAAWEVPAGSPHAREGRWVPGPGLAIFERLGLVGSDAIIAEDLGIITDDVRDLLRASRFPGMKVLQFAFDSDAGNEHLPHNHTPNAVVYTGTHDNTTSAAWLDSLSHEVRQHVADYLGADSGRLLDAAIRATLASVAETAVIPLQDLMALGKEARMNTPSERDGNWRWRFTWDSVDERRVEWFAHMVELYGRS